MGGLRLRDRIATCNKPAAGGGGSPVDMASRPHHASDRRQVFDARYPQVSSLSSIAL